MLDCAQQMKGGQRVYCAPSLDLLSERTRWRKRPTHCLNGFDFGRLSGLSQSEAVEALVYAGRRFRPTVFEMRLGRSWARQNRLGWGPSKIDIREL